MDFNFFVLHVLVMRFAYLLTAAVAAEEVVVDLANGRKLMIDGTVVSSIATAPYAVALLECVISNGSYYCGKFCSGSLIAPDVVLTAGHCTHDAGSPYGVENPPRSLSRLYILAGTSNLYNGQGTLVKIASLHNAGFALNVRYQLDNDAGLAFLGSCVTIRPGIVETIKVATLSSEPDWTNQSTCGDRVVKAFGFGLKTNLPSQIATDDGTLKSIESTVHSPATCSQAYVDASMASIGLDKTILDYPQYAAYRDLYYSTVVSDYHLCSGGQTTPSTCFGDSGGPVVAFPGDASRRQIVGVTSFGVSQFCGLGPDFIQKTATHSQWIVDMIAANGRSCAATSAAFASWPITSLTPTEHSSTFKTSRCTSNTTPWQCTWGRCLATSNVCNGVSDCGAGDTSDEGSSFCPVRRLLEENDDELQKLVNDYKMKHPDVVHKNAENPNPTVVIVGSLADKRVSSDLPSSLPPLPAVARPLLPPRPNVKATISCSNINSTISAMITAAKTAGTNAAETDSSTFESACITEKTCFGQTGFVLDTSIDNFCTDMLNFITNKSVAAQLEAGFGVKYSETCTLSGSTTTSSTSAPTVTSSTTTSTTTTTTRTTTTRATTTKLTTTKKATTTKRTTTRRTTARRTAARTTRRR